MSDPAPPFPCRGARVRRVIETHALWGRGEGADDPVREVVQWWTLDGVLLATHDPCKTVVDGGAPDA